MLRADIRSGIRNPARWVIVLILLLLWFFIEAKYVRIPNLETESLDSLRLTFGSDAETLDEFMVDYLSIMLRKIGHDASGISWFLPTMSGLLIATSFGSRDVQFLLMRGVSRGKFMAIKMLHFAVVILLMHLAALLLHVVRMGGAFAFRNLDWGLFFTIFWTRSLFILAWLSVTVMIAFVSQNTFITLGLSYAYLILSAALGAYNAIRPYFPIYYKDYWRDPTQLDMLHSGILVSVIYLVIFTLLSYLFFRRATIVRD